MTDTVWSGLRVLESEQYRTYFYTNALKLSLGSRYIAMALTHIALTRTKPRGTVDTLRESLLFMLTVIPLSFVHLWIVCLMVGDLFTISMGHAESRYGCVAQRTANQIQLLSGTLGYGTRGVECGIGV